MHARFSDPILIAGSLCFTDADGTAVTLRVLQGSVSVVMAGRDILQTSRKGVTYVVGQDLLMESVELVDSTARTTVVITARGGADGVYGTPDDAETLKYIFEKVRIDARAYPHGRAPRKG